MKTILHLFLIAFLLSTPLKKVDAQTLKSPDASQLATVMQRIGLTDIRITYHSPLVRNRDIWGELVPYDSVWRAGANENTTISFSTDVKIDDQPLAAGTYGLHMIPSRNEWTIIFSKNSTSWGSFFYNPAEDALRIKTTPTAAENQDWLSYQFLSPQKSFVNVNLRWEKISVSFKVDVDVNETVFQSMKEELRGLNAFTWEAPLQAARFCLANKIHLKEGKEWAELSVGNQENGVNLFTLAKYLALEGKSEEALATNEKAKKLANEAQLNAYGYALLAEKNTKEAIEIFALNVKRYPESWNTYDSLAEAYDADNNKKAALVNYRMAYSKAPINQQARIEQIIKKLEAH